MSGQERIGSEDDRNATRAGREAQGWHKGGWNVEDESGVDL